MRTGLLQTLAWLGVILMIVAGIIELSSLTMPLSVMAERGLIALIIGGAGAILAVGAYLADMWINSKPKP